MAVNLLFGLACLVIIVIVFSSRARQQTSTKRSREHLLAACAAVVGGTLSSEAVLAGTYKDHLVEVSLRSTGRIDSVGSHSSANNIEVVLLVVRNVSGAHPWALFTSNAIGPFGQKWRSAIGFTGVVGKLLVKMSPIQIDPGTEDRLRQGGMLEALERFAPSGAKSLPYIVVSFVPDAQAIAATLQRIEAVGLQVAEAARREAVEQLKQGGHLRIEVERAGALDPTPDRLRELLEAAAGVARLNAAINI